MKQKHPMRKRAVLYGLIPFIVFGLMMVTGMSALNYDETTRINHALATLSGISLLLLVIFTIPFWFYAVKYWLLQDTTPILPTAKDEDIVFGVDYSTSTIARIFGNIFPRKAILTWNNVTKEISLKTKDKTVFSTTYSALDSFHVDFSMITISCNGKRYTCFPNDSVLSVFNNVGIATTNQSATIALGTAKVESGGFPELAAYIKNEGVTVTYAKIGRSVELGIFSAFIILFTGGIIVSVFLVK